MVKKNWSVYLIRCADNSLYCGITSDIKNRLIEHNSGKVAKYTRSRRPVKLVGVGPKMTKSEALNVTGQIFQSFFVVRPDSMTAINIESAVALSEA